MSDVEKLFEVTTKPAPEQKTRLNPDSLPDSAAYWWGVRGHEREEKKSCHCPVPIVGLPETPSRWTCRICAGKVSWSIRGKYKRQLRRKKYKESSHDQ